MQSFRVESHSIWHFLLSFSQTTLHSQQLFKNLFSPSFLPSSQGKTLYINLLAVGPRDNEGIREIYFEMNGSGRVIEIRDDKADVVTAKRAQANPQNPNEVGAPMAGAVVDVRVKIGSLIKIGDPLVVLNAMKMVCRMNWDFDSTLFVDEMVLGWFGKLFCWKKIQI